MGLSRSKREFLVGVLGEERVAKIEKYYHDKSRDLEEAGIDFKELTETLNGIARGTTELREPASEKDTDWTPRRRTPTGTAEKKEMPPSLVESLVQDLTGGGTDA